MKVAIKEGFLSCRFQPNEVTQKKFEILIEFFSFFVMFKSFEEHLKCSVLLYRFLNYFSHQKEGR